MAFDPHSGHSQSCRGVLWEESSHSRGVSIIWARPPGGLRFPPPPRSRAATASPKKTNYFIRLSLHFGLIGHMRASISGWFVKVGGWQILIRCNEIQQFGRAVSGAHLKARLPPRNKTKGRVSGFRFRSKAAVEFCGLGLRFEVAV